MSLLLRVLEICVLPAERRIKLQVEMPDPDICMTGQVPHLPRQIFRLLPRLSHHTCHNGQGLTFRQECKNTEIPHLFEHLIIELQLQAQQRPTDVLRGETEWDWQRDPRGRFNVSVDYDNELLAVGAIRLAERVIREIDERNMTLDITVEVARLRHLLALGCALQGETVASPVSSPAALPPLNLAAPRLSQPA